MIFIIMSDNHGNESSLETIIGRHQGEADKWIHCGDSELKRNHPLLSQMICVKGNCDFFSPGFDPEYITSIGDNQNMLIVHGHRHGVNYGHTDLLEAASDLDQNIAIICYGHTHVPYMKMKEGVLIINPGSTVQPRTMERIKTYAKLIVTKEQFEIELLEVETGKLVEKAVFERSSI